MNDEKKQTLEVSETISKDFDKAGISSIITSESFDNLEQLKKYLTSRIIELLDRNYEKLLNILYRIDINEDKLNDLFGSKNRDYIPEHLAELIIERQLQKIKFRNAYREKNKEISED
jgi:hypothetical protein